VVEYEQSDEDSDYASEDEDLESLKSKRSDPLEPWQDILNVTANLNDLLPAIRSQRQIRLLRIEQAKASPPEEPSSIADSPKVQEEVPKLTPLTVGPADVRYTVERNLRLATDLEEALKNDEEFAKKQEITDIETFSPSIRKHRERLQQIQYKLIQEPKAQFGPKEAEAVSKLNKALLAVTKELLVSARKGTLNIPSEKVSGKGIDMEQKLHDLLGTFENSNSILVTVL